MLNTDRFEAALGMAKNLGESAEVWVVLIPQRSYVVLAPRENILDSPTEHRSRGRRQMSCQILSGGRVRPNYEAMVRREAI